MATPTDGPPLRPEQYDRYRRHLILPEIGLEGQRALLDARVLLVGAGGLGCPTAQYLAAAGVGTLGIVDFDRVDASNLHRQILYGTADVGRLEGGGGRGADRRDEPRRAASSATRRSSPPRTRSRCSRSTT